MSDLPLIKEAGLAVRVIQGPKEHEQAFRLRHTIYCRRLRWVLGYANDLEIDDYDSHAISLGVFNETERLLGVVRILPGTGSFMLEQEFRSLLDPGYCLQKGPHVIELTRLATLAAGIPPWHAALIARLLYKGLYHWVTREDIHLLYFVVETRYLKALWRQGLPCQTLGRSQRMADGPECVAVLLSRKGPYESSALIPRILPHRPIKAFGPGSDRNPPASSAVISFDAQT